MELPQPLRTIAEYAMLGMAIIFTASGISGLWSYIIGGTFSWSGLLLAKIVGNALDGIRLIGNELPSGAGGNHILTIIILGVLGIALVACRKSDGFFRWLWVFGWHEELWTLGLTIYYLRFLNIAWITPLILSWAVLFIVASLFWGHINKRDWIFIGLSGIYFVGWILTGMHLSSCIGMDSFVGNCGDTLANNATEIGSWVWMIAIGAIMWLRNWHKK